MNERRRGMNKFWCNKQKTYTLKRESSLLDENKEKTKTEQATGMQINLQFNDYFT